MPIFVLSHCKSTYYFKSVYSHFEINNTFTWFTFNNTVSKFINIKDLQITIFS